ncbi:MAG: single-stranded DNA-binding protein [Trueperella sp.]|nr:single-stranded DNA-binding protein [Trueperella sp.]
MSNDTVISVRGWVGADPTTFENNSDAEAARSNKTVVIRVGVTPSYYSRRSKQYENGSTVWYAVRTYGTLAENVAGCIRKGSPVLVRGRLTQRSYADRTGVERQENVIIADALGIELTTGQANFMKVSSAQLDDIPGEPGVNFAEIEPEADGEYVPTDTDADPAGVLAEV